MKRSLRCVVFLVFIVSLVTLCLLLFGCAAKEAAPKPVCTTDSDCVKDNAPKTCANWYCDSKFQCKTRATNNCCGNKICEAASFENSCTCTQDCGACGNISVKASSTAPKNIYLISACVANDGKTFPKAFAQVCGKAINTSKAMTFNKQQNLKIASIFDVSINKKYPIPMIANKDNLEMRFTLEDYSKDIGKNLEIYHIEIVDGKSNLIGEDFSTHRLYALGDSFVFKFPYVPPNNEVMERTYKLTAVISYQYTKQSKVTAGKNPDGTTAFNIVDDGVERVSQGAKQTFNEDITFITI